MQTLIDGVRAFHARMTTGAADVYAPLAEGQAPTTLFFACSDSRVVPAFLASAEPGHLFTVRNVGNLVPPAGSDGHSTGDRSEASAIEYAVEKLGVTDIVVCGHSGCGAMTALLGGGDALPCNLDAWLAHARPALDDATLASIVDPHGDPVDTLSRRNVVQQLRSLGTWPMVALRVADGRMRLHGWWFDIRRTRIEVWNGLSFVAFETAFPGGAS